MNEEKPSLEKRILYMNDACVVINKLPGESVEPLVQPLAELPGAANAGMTPGAITPSQSPASAPKGGMTSLPLLLAKHFAGAGAKVPPGALPFPQAAHRLDVPVSGALVFARTPGALSVLEEAFRRGQMEKHYWAITELPPPGKTISESGELVHWLMIDTKRNKTIAYGEEKPGSKRAALRYRVIGRGDHYLFMEIELITGRHHQIRAQLAALGLHIKGDLKYGARRSEKAGGIRLHAASLSFPNPLGRSETVKVDAPPPVTDALWEAFIKARGACREMI